ncbi:MAG: undecaprenyl-diphosphate phosphatase [Cyclobacteriaceae bacterium]
MTWIEAVILGILQGLTEFLPVSSSGHIEIGSVLLGTEVSNNLLFSIVVHAATALSTIIVFRNDILEIIKGLIKFTWNDEVQFALKIIISMVPVGIVGVLFEDQITSLFTGQIMSVGSMLLITGTLLIFTHFQKDHSREISYISALIIGLAQAFAIMPGISRSGATIATALLLKTKKESATKFSFLMVLIPIMGATLLKVLDLSNNVNASNDISGLALTAGFLAALISGLLACQWMIAIVKKGKLTYFAFYCLLVGGIAIISQL